VKILILGFGSIGQRHARILGGQLGHDVELVTRRDAAGFRRHPSLAEAGDLGRFDYFVVATATHLHHRQLAELDAEVAGRTILVEKPLFFPETHYGPPRNRVFVGYNLRFHPALRKARELLEGRPVAAVSVRAGEYLPWWRPGTDYRVCYSARRAEGGGVVLDLSHEIDYVQWLFGPLTRLVSLAGHLSGLEIDSDDYASVLALTERGTAVDLTLDYLSTLPQRSMLARTRDGTVLLDLRRSTVTACDSGGRREDWDFSAADRDYSYRELHRAVLERDGLDACTLDQGLAVLRMVRGIYSNNLLADPPADGEGPAC
jgi:CMP-N,N'-diacetyllegionaminic acid synthase